MKKKLTSEQRQEIRDRDLEAEAAKMTSVDLVEWLAQVAVTGKEDWGWISKEILRRIPPNAEPDGAEYPHIFTGVKP